MWYQAWLRKNITKPTVQDPEESTLEPLVIDTKKSRGDDGVQMGNPILESRGLKAMSAVVCNFVAALRGKLCHFPLSSKPACCYQRIPDSC